MKLSETIPNHSYKSELDFSKHFIARLLDVQKKHHRKYQAEYFLRYGLLKCIYILHVIE